MTIRAPYLTDKQIGYARAALTAQAFTLDNPDEITAILAALDAAEPAIEPPDFCPGCGYDLNDVVPPGIGGTCQMVSIDTDEGRETLLVHGDPDADLGEHDRAALAEVVAAARRRFQADHPDTAVEPEPASPARSAVEAALQPFIISPTRRRRAVNAMFGMIDATVVSTSGVLDPLPLPHRVDGPGLGDVELLLDAHYGWRCRRCGETSDGHGWAGRSDAEHNATGHECADVTNTAESEA